MKSKQKINNIEDVDGNINTSGGLLYGSSHVA